MQERGRAELGISRDTVHRLIRTGALDQEMDEVRRSVRRKRATRKTCTANRVEADCGTIQRAMIRSEDVPSSPLLH